VDADWCLLCLGKRLCGLLTAQQWA
jgi:hypothetical protein